MARRLLFLHNRAEILREDGERGGETGQHGHTAEAVDGKALKLLERDVFGGRQGVELQGVHVTARHPLVAKAIGAQAAARAAAAPCCLPLGQPPRAPLNVLHGARG